MLISGIDQITHKWCSDEGSADDSVLIKIYNLCEIRNKGAYICCLSIIIAKPINVS